jgi:uncharacterized repeat protein (TIGR01451 family)
MVPTVFDVVVSKANPDVVLAATGGDTRIQSKNGIYRSSDGGNSWGDEPVHQFMCSGSPGPVSQIVSAGDDPNLLFAAGGCAIAKSTDAGLTWVDKVMPGAATVWHVVVAPQENAIRRVYAAGDDKIFYSQDEGNSWFEDTAAVIPNMGMFQGTQFGVVGGFPIVAGAGGNSSQVLAVEPGHPDHVFVAVTNISNGPGYYFSCYVLTEGGPCVDQNTPGSFLWRIPDGFNCEARVGCGGAAVWLGDYSSFFQQSQKGNWSRMASPPAYNDTAGSGRTYLVTKQTASGYLLFLADNFHVHVSQGRPERSALWHRLTGTDASQSKRDAHGGDPAGSDQLFVHVDPMAIAVSSNFDITLKPVTDLDFPYNQNSELDQFLRGRIWMGNDGGAYRSTDGGVIWSLTSGLATLAPSAKFALLPSPGTGPGLFFGVPDNDDFVSTDGGRTWDNDQVFNCGDCGLRFSDPAQPDRVLEIEGPGRGTIAVRGNSFRYLPPFPEGFIMSSAFENGYSSSKEGYRPIILTINDQPNEPNGDYILIRQITAGRRVLVRTTRINEITTQADWNAIPVQQGPDLIGELQNVWVVQASGGHERPTFYVADPGASNSLWKWTQGMPNWQPIVPADDGSATVVRRFFVHPYDPTLIYIIDQDAIKRSTNGGQTWEIDESLDAAVTENRSFSYDPATLPGWVGRTAIINDMTFDRVDPKTRFAVGNAGVFVTANGKDWKRLLSTTALPGYPAAAYFDRISDPSNPVLYVAVNGRGIISLGPIHTADLAITKAVSANAVTTGNNVSYTITVTNNGPATATSVIMTDNLPAETTFVSCFSTGGGVCSGSGNNRTVTFASLTSGQSETITFVSTANCSLADGTMISNTATVSADTPDPNPDNDAMTATTMASNPAPAISGASASPSVLWPPNHHMVNVTVSYGVTDNCPLPPNSCTLSVTGNEQINGDWIVLDAHHVQLRAEREGHGNGRIYTVTVRCTDSGGNSSSKSVTVSVPHDRGRR